MSKVSDNPGYVNIVTATLTNMFRWNFAWDSEWNPTRGPDDDPDEVLTGPGIIPCGQFCLYYAGVTRPDGVFQATADGVLTLKPTAWRHVGSGEVETQEFEPIEINITDRGWNTPSDDLLTSWFWVAKIVPPLCRDFFANWTVSYTGTVEPDVLWFGEYIVMGANVMIHGRPPAEVTSGLLTLQPEVNDGETFEMAHPVYVQVNLYPW